MSALGKPPILLTMENFSTPRQPLVPWAANVATLAVMVAATWWSSDQRPANAVQAEAPVSPSTGSSLQARQPIAAPAPSTHTGATPTRWPAQTTSRQGDGIQPVSFGATALR